MNAPIGVYDSGVGGLTVASAISRLLPNESMVYFGDTRHSPYGDKSQETIIEYSERICDFLLSKNCKAIVIACNTASALAYDYLRERHPELLIVNVVDPVVRYVATEIEGKVGIIATRATTQSNIYTEKLKKISPGLNTVSAATPLLVSVVEEGFANTEISKCAIRAYLDNDTFKDLSALIPGCTHFPLLHRELKAFYNNNTEIIDAPELVADHLRSSLDKHELAAADGATSQYEFFISEKTSSFEAIARNFFGANISLDEKVL